MKRILPPKIIKSLIFFLFSITFAYSQNTEIGERCSMAHMTNEEIAETQRIFQEIIKDSANLKRNSNKKYVLPVVFHVMSLRGASYNDIRCRVDEVIDMINRDFQGLNGPTNSMYYERTDSRFNRIKKSINIEVCLAKKDPWGKTMSDPGIDWQLKHSLGTVSHGTDRDIYKYNWYGKNGRYYVDVFLSGCVRSDCKVNSSGFAYFPTTSRPPMTVYNVRALGTKCGSTGYLNWANTISHEFGHILGLPHTFGSTSGNCVSDGVHDTPPTNGQDGCVANKKNSCGVYPNYENYMDYNSRCYRMWTKNQVDVMTYWLEDNSKAPYPRGRLHTQQNLVNVGCASVVDNCPNDPNKLEPGDCGCGVADTDTDKDGTADCDDSCPNDPGKTKPGECGCGVEEGSCDDDCNGNPGGWAYIDECGDCVGGQTNKAACVPVCSNNPATSGDSRCGAGQVDLSAVAKNGGTLNWYTSLVGGASISTGSSYSPTINSTKTFYVEEVVPGSGNSGYVGPRSNTTIDESGDYTVGKVERGLVFDAYSNMKIKTVDVFCSTNGQVIVSLKNAAGTVIESQTHRVTNSSSKQTLDLNMNVHRGNDYRLTMISATNNTVVVQRNYNCNINYPYTLNGITSIKRGTFSNNEDCQGYENFYYFFYNWSVQQNIGGCTSERIKVTGVVENSDSDSDGALDCADECPNDPNKIEPGECGCGSIEQDPCEDSCPDDPNKTSPGLCGCGIPEGTCQDCNNVAGGTAYIDGCGECVGGNTGNTECVSTCVNTPEVKGDERCGSGLVDLSALPSNGGRLLWYESSSGGSSVAEGETYSTNVNNSTTFYVQEIVEEETSSVGPENNNSITNSEDYTVNNNSRGLVFDAFSDFTLKTVDVYCSTVGSVVITLKNSSGGTVISKNISVTSNGKQTLELNMDIPKGSDYQLIMNSSSGDLVFQRNYDCNKYGVPYTLPGVVSIKSGNFMVQGDDCHKYVNYYYYFYNWIVKEASSPDACVSKIVAVEAVVDDSPDCFISVNELDKDALKVTLFPNPTKGIVNIELSEVVNYSYIVSDIIGRTVISGSVDGEKVHQLDLKTINNGIYLIRVIGKDINSVYRISKK